MNECASPTYRPHDYGWLCPPAVPYTRGRWTWTERPAGCYAAYDQELRPLFHLTRAGGTTGDVARLQAAPALHDALTHLALLVRDYLDAHDDAAPCTDAACWETLQGAVARAEALLRALPPDVRTGEITPADLPRAS